MPEAEFGVTYDGPALADGRMPVKDLAPSLLALGDLFTEASLVAYPDRDPVALNIRSASRGSFVVDLAVHSPDAWDRVVQLLTSRTAEALLALQAIVFGPAGFLWFIKAVAGRVIAKKETVRAGHVRLTLSDGTTLEVGSEVLILYERQSARDNAKQVVEPLQRSGVDSLRFARGDEQLLAIAEADLPAYEPPEPDEELLLDQEVEAVVTLATATLEGDYKWRFSEGDRIFTASLEDPAFRARIEDGEAFRQGDMLRVRMRVVQTERRNTLHAERTVLEVLEHYPRRLQTQIDLDTDEGDGE
jgi:hypothetical protein